MIIRNIWCVGRNYKEHALELKNPVSDPADAPIIFLKAGSCAGVHSPEIVLPKWASVVHHEVEIAVKFNHNLQITEAAVALDLTERSVQNFAKVKGQPWTLAKSFKESCPVSAFFRLKDVQEAMDLKFHLWVNDELKQSGHTQDMTHSVPDLVEYVLDMFPVCPGDILLTGTPAGVGPVLRGDKLRAQVENQITHVWNVQ